MPAITNNLNPPSATTHNLAAADASGKNPFEAVQNHVLSRIFQIAIENPHDAIVYSQVSKRFHALIFGDLSQALPLWNKVIDRHFPRPQFTPVDGSCLEAYRKNHLFCRNLASGNYTQQTMEGFGGPNVVVAEGLIYAQSDDWAHADKLEIWNPKTGLLEGSIGQIQDLICFAAGDGKIVWGNQEGRIGIWDIKTKTMEKEFNGFSSLVSSIVVTDEKIVSTSYSGEEGTIKIWNLKTGCLIRTLSGTGEIVSLAVHERKIFGGYRDGFGIWDLNKGDLLFEDRDKVRNAPFTLLVFDGQIFTLGSTQFIIYNLATLKVELEYKKGDDTGVVAITIVNGKIICGTDDGELTIWDLKTKAREKTLNCEFPIHSINCIDGKLVIGIYYENNDAVYNTIILDFLIEPQNTQSAKRIKLNPE